MSIPAFSTLIAHRLPRKLFNSNVEISSMHDQFHSQGKNLFGNFRIKLFMTEVCPNILQLRSKEAALGELIEAWIGRNPDNGVEEVLNSMAKAFALSPQNHRLAFEGLRDRALNLEHNPLSSHCTFVFVALHNPYIHAFSFRGSSFGATAFGTPLIRTLAGTTWKFVFRRVAEFCFKTMYICITV